MYASGGNTQADMAAFGMPASMAKSLEDAPCQVWKCNWKTVQLFIAMGTQWRVGMSGATGLDYSAIKSTAKLCGIKLTPERFAGLQVMEQEVIKVISVKRRVTQ